jgi:hypothetical protein
MAGSAAGRWHLATDERSSAGRVKPGTPRLRPVADRQDETHPQGVGFRELIPGMWNDLSASSASGFAVPLGDSPSSTRGSATCQALPHLRSIDGSAVLCSEAPPVIDDGRHGPLPQTIT